MSMKSAIVIHSYHPDQDGHGGSHRSLQIRNKLVEEFGSELISFSVEDLAPRDAITPSLMLTATRMLPYLKRFRFSSWLRLVAACNILQKLNVCGFDKVFVEQSPNQSIYFSAAIALMGSEYTLIPHNVEFLVAGQSFADESIPYLLVKLSAESANDIWTISEFDKKIFEIFNQNTKFLPYSPPPEVANDLKRSLKSLTSQETEGLLRSTDYELERFKFILSIGTFDNPPSRKGAIRLSALFEANKFGEADFLVFTGRGSDSLIFGRSKKIIKLGYVDSQLLMALVMRCTAIVIYQVPTTGWMTRLNTLSGFGKIIHVNGDYLSGKGYEIAKLSPYQIQDVGAVGLE